MILGYFESSQSYGDCSISWLVRPFNIDTCRYINYVIRVGGITIFWIQGEFGYDQHLHDLDY